MYRTFEQPSVFVKLSLPLHTLLCDAATLALLPLEITVSELQTIAVETEFLFDINYAQVSELSKFQNEPML